MTQMNLLFLEALKASLTGSKISWTPEEISVETLTELFNLASVHHVLPMIFDAVFSSPACSALAPQHMMMLRQNTMRSVSVQTVKTEQFKRLFSGLLESGLRPCVVKGVICRSLYPNPDFRVSGDEDVLIREEDFFLVDKYFRQFGLEPEEEITNPESVYELPYMQKRGSLYIELHKQLFPSESEAYGDMNTFFQNVHDRLTEVTVDGGRYVTMHPTDHLFYLICHSFKHFLHSGFGIRQVCDIILFANAYGERIDWNYVLESCRTIRADLFAVSLFRIGKKYLVFDPEKACWPQEWQEITVDEEPMLMDLLDSGVFGQADMSRKHSSNITLQAIIADKRGKKSNTGIAGSIFLPVESMKKRFRYLERFPWLLPAAWIHRILIYRKESGKNSRNNAADSIRIGNKRVELMRMYGIIK